MDIKRKHVGIAVLMATWLGCATTLLTTVVLHKIGTIEANEWAGLWVPTIFIFLIITVITVINFFIWAFQDRSEEIIYSTKGGKHETVI